MGSGVPRKGSTFPNFSPAEKVCFRIEFMYKLQ